MSCYNSLKIGGGAHTLVRLNLKEVALRHTGDADGFLADTLPHYVELTAELAEARIRSLVDEQHFFDTHWLATEGLFARPVLGDVRRVRPGRVREPAAAHDGLDRDGAARYGHDDVADALAVRVVERLAELVAARPVPYCGGGGGRCYLHSQGGIDTDDGVTAGTRIPVGDEPDLLHHLRTCAPHHRFFAAGDQRHRPPRRDRGAQPARRWSTSSAARSPPACATSRSTSTRNEFVRITGYLVRKSDLAAIAAERQAPGTRATSSAAGSEAAYHLTERAVKRIGCHELTLERASAQPPGSASLTRRVQLRRRAGQPLRGVPAGLQLRLRRLPQPADDPRPRAGRRPPARASGATDELVAEIRRAAPFLVGVTVSGGEATLQAAFVHALFDCAGGRTRRWPT